MRLATSIAIFIAGIIAGIIFVVSCGDDSRAKADAAVDAPKLDAPATCDCPPAELPLAGRIVVVDSTTTIPGNGTGASEAVCPAGAQVISGSCTTATLNPFRDVTLQQSGFYVTTGLGSWTCFFRNNEATPVTIKVSVICLKPTP